MIGSKANKLLKVCSIFLAGFFMFSCVKSKPNQVDHMVFIDEVEWVKLLPDAADEQGRIMVSTGCGQAEIKLKNGHAGIQLISMNMGEWCHTPHKSIPVAQVFVVNSAAELVDYFSIHIGQNKNHGVEYIDLLESSNPLDSVLANLLKPLKTPVLMGEVEDEDLKAYGRYISAGIVKQEGGFLYLKQVVLIRDIKAKFIRN